MSYINQTTFKLNKRRHPTQHLTQDELTVDKFNQVVDEANNQIARTLAYSKNLEEQVNTLFEENKQLRQQLAYRDRHIEQLEAEVSRLKKKSTPKAGKRKGVEWDEID